MRIGLPEIKVTAASNMPDVPKEAWAVHASDRGPLIQAEQKGKAMNSTALPWHGFIGLVYSTHRDHVWVRLPYLRKAHSIGFPRSSLEKMR